MAPSLEVCLGEPLFPPLFSQNQRVPRSTHAELAEKSPANGPSFRNHKHVGTNHPETYQVLIEDTIEDT